MAYLRKGSDTSLAWLDLPPCALFALVPPPITHAKEGLATLDYLDTNMASEAMSVASNFPGMGSDPPTANYHGFSMHTCADFSPPNLTAVPTPLMSSQQLMVNLFI